MRILLIAYEWPPITAAQSLRWFYLANGLAELGVKVHVICPKIRPEMHFCGTLHDNIREHRVWPGPFVGFLQVLIELVGRRKSLHESSEFHTKKTSSHLINGFIRRCYICTRRLLNQIIFPDIRTEWYPFARSNLIRLLNLYQFDAVISSHEPGVDLMLGLLAKRKFNLPWIVDLADPLIAPYTPKWRKRLDMWFERLVLQESTCVILTTPYLADTLVKRHTTSLAEKFVTIPQGGVVMKAEEIYKRPAGELHLVFTGNFYKTFRNPSELAKALKRRKLDNIRFTIAGNNSDFESLFSEIDGVNFLGTIDHFNALKLQQEADILVNIGNAQIDQLPGKLFEYLCAGKPILHILNSSPDLSELYLKDHSCIFIAQNNEESIFLALERIVSAHLCGELQVSPDNFRYLTEKHGWKSRAINLKLALEVAITLQN